MAPFERWLEVKRIFEAALEVEPEERAAFLDRTCGGDQELRAEVEALLGAPAVPTAALANLLGLPGRQEEPDYGEGDRIDHFAIVRRVGQGGMGVVYEARDTRNNDRPVALKVLFSRAVTLSQDKRLAGLTHPAIVTFHDSGETSEGLPYFVFEFIEGEPITAFCDRREFALPERLRLFQKVCDPVAYAHQRGVIHCDLKPENILVTATGELKLLDFGIAREVGAGGIAPGEPSPLTLPFASPEQVGNEETTTLSDVYSLGVLLAVLLTGRLPYRRAQTVSELRDAILHEPPSPPSETVTAADDGAARIASAPPAENATKLARQLRGDLDAIVAKALRKEPPQRYVSVQEFADDISRHLARRPVIAREPSLSYRSGRFLERHWVAAVLAASIALGILLFSVALAQQYRESVRQRDQARAQAALATTISRFLTDLFKLSDPTRRPGGVVTVRELLDKAASELPGTLRTQPETVIPLLNTLGQIYVNLGLFDQSAKCHRYALQIATQSLPAEHLLTAESLFYLGIAERSLGHLPPAKALEENALAIRERHLPAASPDIAKSLYQLGLVASGERQFGQAERLFRRAIALCRSAPQQDLEALGTYLHALGTALQEEHRYKEAEETLRSALAAHVKIYGQDHALIAPILADLAIVLENQARFPEAETLQRQAIAIDTRALGNDHPETIVALNDLAFILETKGDLNRATETFRDAANRAKRALGSEHPTTIAIEVNFGRSLEFIGKLAEAEAVLDDTYRAAVKAHGPNDWQVGNILKTEAEVLAERRDVRDAADKFERAAAIFARTDGPTAYTVIGTRAELGSCLARQGRFADGEPLLLAYYHQAIERDKPEAAERLFGLYTVWGKKEKAAEYRRFIVEHFPSHLPHLAKYEDGKYLVTTPTASPSPR